MQGIRARPVSGAKVKVRLSVVLTGSTAWGAGRHSGGPSRGPELLQEIWHRKEMWGLSQGKTFPKVMYWVELCDPDPPSKKLCPTLVPVNGTPLGNIFADVLTHLQMRSI